MEKTPISHVIQAVCYSLGMILNYSYLDRAVAFVTFITQNQDIKKTDSFIEQVIGTAFVFIIDAFYFFYRCLRELTNYRKVKSDLELLVLHPDGAWLFPGTLLILIGIAVYILTRFIKETREA